MPASGTAEGGSSIPLNVFQSAFRWVDMVLSREATSSRLASWFSGDGHRVRERAHEPILPRMPDELQRPLPKIQEFLLRVYG